MANSQNKNKKHPKNIGIIMDGNGRWAIKNALNISQGHKKGVSVVKKIVEESVKQGIQSLTLYAFSSENWKRPKTEINAIKSLVIEAINEQVPDLKEQKVKLKFFGCVLRTKMKVKGEFSHLELSSGYISSINNSEQTEIVECNYDDYGNRVPSTIVKKIDDYIFFPKARENGEYERVLLKDM